MTLNHPSVYPLVLGATLTVAMAFVIVFCDGRIDVAAVVLPLAVLACVGMILIVSRKSSFLLAVMIAALLFKFVAAWLFFHIAAEQGADVLDYNNSGAQLAPYVGQLTSIIPLRNLWGTDFIVAVSAVLFALLGHSLAAVIALFAMISFWGQFFFYRAVMIGFPGANPRFAAVVMFFCPSMVYWTATLGKDALMLVAVALVTIGVARRFRPTGWAAILFGLGLATIIRPHVGAFLALSLLGTYALSDISGRKRGLGTKLILLPLLMALCAAPLIYALDTLGLDNLEDAQAMSRSSYAGNNVGGSAVGEDVPLGVRLAGAPLLLFRPLPWEVNNTTAALASLEGLLVGVWILLRRREILRFLRKHRKSPLVVFSVMFFIILSTVFSVSVSNFGLLARQRVAVLPLVLIVLVAAAGRTPKDSLQSSRLEDSCP